MKNNISTQSTETKSNNGCQRSVCFSLLLVLITFLFLTTVTFSQWQNTGGTYCRSGSATIVSSNNSLWLAFEGMSSGNWGSWGITFSKCTDSIWIVSFRLHMYRAGFYDQEMAVCGDTLYAIYTAYPPIAPSELRMIKLSNVLEEGLVVQADEYRDFPKSIAVFKDMPVIAYYEYFSEDLRVIKRRDGIWRDFGYPNGGNHNELNDHFTLEADDSSIYIAGLDSTGAILVKQLFDSSSVNISSPGSSGTRIKSLDLKLINHELYVSFSDRNNGFRASVKKYDGTNWIYVGLPGFSDGPSTDIHLSNDGSVPYVAFNDSVNNGMTVMRFNGLQWSPEGQPGFKNLNWGSYDKQNIAILDGNVYVALTLNDTDFCSGSNSSYVTTMGYGNNLLPIELLSFYSIQGSGIVELFWTTSMEMNNEGFYVERKLSGDEWKSLGFVKGAGNSQVVNAYQYRDRVESSGTYFYRLRQVDFNGNFSYFDLESSVSVGIPEKLILFQNFPNPFNPKTNIAFGLPSSGFMRLRIFDVSGREVIVLMDEFREAGYHKASFDGSTFSSGIYYLRIETENEVMSKKMVLLK